MTASHVARTGLLTAAWLAIAILVALGGAGVVAALNHLPGTDARPELTWAGDAVAVPALDAATARLQALSDAVDALGGDARDALAELVGGDAAALSGTIDAGGKQLAAVGIASDALSTSLAAIPYTGAHGVLFLSPAVLHRYDELQKTRGVDAGLAGNWAVLSARALSAASVPALLARHDTQTAAAAKEGTGGHYQQALALLDAPDATIATARAIAGRLADVSDVSTLTTWLDRNAAYDAALRTLYTSLVGAKGKVTNAVRTAIAGEQAARAALPADTRAIVVIMADIARGGLNKAVIDIEVARGALAAALDVQHRLRPGATPAP